MGTLLRCLARFILFNVSVCPLISMFHKSVLTLVLGFLVAAESVAVRRQTSTEDEESPMTCLTELEGQASRVEELIKDIEDRDRRIENLEARLSNKTTEEFRSTLEDCVDILQLEPSAPTEVYPITLLSRFLQPALRFVLCDMVTEGGGWTVIQRRNTGIVNFFQNFETYAEGFGDLGPNSEFWIGNRLLHELTSRWNYEMIIELTNADGEMKQVHYDTFKVDSECNGFSLTLDYSEDSDLPNSMRSNRQMKFSTFDNDNDMSKDNCALRFQGAWWYNNCTESNLNGLFLPAGTAMDPSIHWYGWEQNRALAFVEMKIRPRAVDEECTDRASTDPMPSTTTTHPTTTTSTTAHPTTTTTLPTPSTTTRPTTSPTTTTITSPATTTTTSPTTTTAPATTETAAPTGEDCFAILNNNPAASSGEYSLMLLGGNIIRVYCDMETDGGGWTVFQRRVNGSVDFYQNYDTYAQGFGIVSHEFWLGNDNLNLLTSHGDQELRVDLEDYEGNVGYANYDSFTVGSASDGYRLHVSGYNGTAGDSLFYNDNHMFSAYDRDQDSWPHNCAIDRDSAWWYNDCTFADLNSVYSDASTSNTELKGILWYYWHHDHRSMKHTEMKLRRH